MKINFRILPLLLALMLCLPAFADGLPEYQIQNAGSGAQGTYLVKISVLGKKKDINDDVLARCAVHGVLFRGMTDAEGRRHIKPLAGSAATEGQHADYFKDFFDKGGAAKNYVEFVNSTRTVIKSGKQHKVTATVVVSKDQLRKDLESAGVLKGLNSIF